MVHTIPLSDRERETGELSGPHLQTAIEAIRTDGCVALANACDPAHVELVGQRMAADIADFNASNEQPFVGGNFFPSRNREYLFDDILMNPAVAAVLLELLGGEVSCGLYSSNVTMPGLGDQQLHVDMNPHNEEDDLSGPCRTVVVNFPLVDFTVENGATEIWPGTQHLKREPGEFWVSRRLQDERRPVRPPVRAILLRGSVLIRDIRLWHRGVLNTQQHIRPMLALIMNGKYDPETALPDGIAPIGPFPEESRAFFADNSRIHYNPQFTETPVPAAPGK